jgi:hypothetical protein
MFVTLPAARVRQRHADALQRRSACRRHAFIIFSLTPAYCHIFSATLIFSFLRFRRCHYYAMRSAEIRYYAGDGALLLLIYFAAITPLFRRRASKPPDFRHYAADARR